jgi:predicted transcriptional regulator of viral defense system
MKISEFLSTLISKGYCSFTSNQAQEALGSSEIAIRASIRRLKKKGELAQPINGFYVIVPPEYRVIGCRPAEHFITELMEYIGAPYYIGLLSAAQYYGAAHHRPQQFQIITNQKRRPITCGQVKIVFITNKDAAETPTQKINSSHGYLTVSTPEATARDIVIYANRCGGIENTLDILRDLVEKIDVKKLLKLVSKSKEITWVQRLGYLLESENINEISEKLEKKIRNHIVHFRALEPANFTLNYDIFLKSFINDSISKKEKSEKKYLINSFESIKKETKFKINKKWKLIINKKLEKDT